MSTNWRYLVVEDDATIASQLLEAIPKFVDPPDTGEADLCKTFKEAMQRLASERYDLIILDLKDDGNAYHAVGSEPAGLSVFEQLKKTRFVPVVFYTAYAQWVRGMETSFVRIVEKTETIDKVKEEVRRVLKTRLPGLARQIEEIQRSYMWGFVSTHWKEFESAHEQTDIAYLLARRLALSLQKEARSLALEVAGDAVPSAGSKNIHPMEMYVRPPVGDKRLAGDILKGVVDGESGYWLVLTPSCDFEQANRLHNVVLGQCVPLTAQPEFEKWRANPSTNADSLKALIGDNRQKAQPERFKFLPGTYFLPDSVVDFQRLKTVSVGELEMLEVIASLDSPFAEAVLARFSRYFGRLGTPDIDKNLVMSRLEPSLKTSGDQQPQPPAKT